MDKFPTVEQINREIEQYSDSESDHMFFLIQQVTECRRTLDQSMEELVKYSHHLQEKYKEVNHVVE